MLLEAAARTARIQATPQPYVLQKALSDFYVDYRLRVRIQDGAARARGCVRLDERIGRVRRVGVDAGREREVPVHERVHDRAHPGAHLPVTTRLPQAAVDLL